MVLTGRVVIDFCCCVAALLVISYLDPTALVVVL